MSGPLRQLTQRIADVAKKTTIQNSPIVQGTVLSRNPDGTLNVDDGRGGCIRQAPAANVRVGEKINLGVEPALGTQTSLPQVTLTLTPSTVPCPTDPRPACEDLIGAPCPPLIEENVSLEANAFSIAWGDPNLTTMTYAGRRDGVWQNRLSAGGELAGGPIDGILFHDSNVKADQDAVRRTDSYTGTSDFSGPYSGQFAVSAYRAFFSFRTAGVVPPDATIEAVKLRVHFTGNGSNRLRSDSGDGFSVVTSTHNGISTDTSNWDKVGETVLGGALIDDIIAAGPQPTGDTVFDYDIDLDLTQLSSQIRSGEVKFAIGMRRDLDKHSTLPTPAQFTGREVTASGITDDKVHIAAGTVTISGATYSDTGTSTVIIPQTDGEGRRLQAGKSYIAALVQHLQDNADLTIIRGTQAVDPTRPDNRDGAVGLGGIILCWIHVSCEEGPSLISDGDIVYPAAGRAFINVSDPNEERDDLDLALFRAADGFQLLIEFKRPAFA